MTTGRLGRIAFGIVATAAACLPRVTEACATCFGARDSSLVKGANAGMAFLLVITLGVMGGVAVFMYTLARRARRHAPESAQASAFPSQ